MSPPNPVQALKNGTEGPNATPLGSATLAISNTVPSNATDPNWVHVGTEIETSRWNKSYPYQLLMVEKTGNGYSTKNTFTLPIPPQELSISVPFAIGVDVTLGGIVEQHNASPIRILTLSGTTGVLPLRATGKILAQTSTVGAIFAGTIAASQNTANAFSSLFNLTAPPDNLVADNPTGDDGKSTGYYQFRLLQQFLESYATLKKNSAHKNLRLAFAIWKDQSVYLVTPERFDVRRTAQSPWEYNYNLQLKAWRRVNLTGAPNPNHGFTAVTRNPNSFAKTLAKVQDARRVLQGAREVLEAVSGDINAALFEPLREVALFCKDGLGVAVAAMDLPLSIIQDLKGPTLEALSLRGSLINLESTANANVKEALADLKSLAVAASKSETDNGTLSTAQSLTGADPANTLFENPQDNPDFFEALSPSDLNLAPETQAKIEAERERIRTFTRLDFETIRDQVESFAVAFADAVGAGSARFDATFGRTTVTSSKTPTDDDFEALFSLNQAVLELSRLAASSDNERDTVTTLDAVAGMASRSGIAFTVPVSKFAVPFPYGSTLEQLAARYLGDPDRWFEIVTLNGLRQPFVDETGFDLPLLTNADGNQVHVSDASNLYIGQKVWLSASNASRIERRVSKIEEVAAGSVLLTLDGDPDLDNYDVAGQATLHAFLPDTVNSQMLIYIPSDDPTSEEDFRTKAIPGLNEFDPLIRVGGIDLLLTDDGDLVLTPDGDGRLAYGLTNLIQQVKLGFATPRGSLLRHPSYGFGILPGTNTAEVSVKDILSGIQDMFSNDPSFAGVSGVSIAKSGPVLSVGMSVAVAGANQTIPISIDIRR